MIFSFRTMQQNCSVRSLAIVFLLLGLSACSTRFIYNQLDWFVVWKIGGYVSLEDEQKAALKTDVHDHLEYVRVNDMPRVAALLDQTAREIESGYISSEMIDARYQEMLGLFDEFMLAIVPITSKFLRSLDEEQIEELFVNLDEINEEMYEDYSGRTPEEREKNRNKSAIRSMQDFTGKLNAEQKELLRTSLANMEDSSEQWIDYQREWQTRFRNLIETRPSEEEYRAELTQLFVYPRNFHTPEYRTIVDANRVIFIEMMAELINGLSDKQRKRMVKKVDGWRKDLLKLSADS
jgi:hypothetical protein